MQFMVHTFYVLKIANHFLDSYRSTLVVEKDQGSKKLEKYDDLN